MTAVEARFAGGPIVVEHVDLHGRQGVTVSMPGDSAGMFPNEARELAAALMAAADDAERDGRRAQLRRRPDVDHHLMSRDV